MIPTDYKFTEIFVLNIFVKIHRNILIVFMFIRINAIRRWFFEMLVENNSVGNYE